MPERPCLVTRVKTEKTAQEKENEVGQLES